MTLTARAPIDRAPTGRGYGPTLDNVCRFEEPTPIPLVPARSDLPGLCEAERVRRVLILGSTGSIGTQAIDVIAANPDRFEVVGLTAGWGRAVGVAVGALVVTAFFSLSGVVVAWAGRIDDAFTLPAALGTFFVKALVLYLVLFSLPADGWLDRTAVAWSVIVGALVWSGVQLRWVWTRQLYYVPPPAPPATASSAGVQPRPVEHPDGRPQGG